MSTETIVRRALISRRGALHLLPAGALALTSLVSACNSVVSVATVLADAKAAVNGLSNILPALKAWVPADKATQIQADLAQASTVLANVAANAPDTTAATALQTVEGLLNATLSALAAVPLIPAPYSTIIQAAAVIVPEIEAVIANVTGAKTAGAPLAVGQMAGSMSIEQARLVLGAR